MISLTLWRSTYTHTHQRAHTVSHAHARRYIGVGIINGCVRGIATNGALVVVGKYDPGHQIFVFDLETGALVRSFASEGSKPGYLGGCVGVAFAPDGNHILVTERSHCRLSLFTLTGEFVRCMGKEFLKDPYDAVYAANGDILVAERYYNKSCVMVLSSDGQTVLKSFGKAGKEPGEFKYPTALAVFGVRVYVLEWSGTRVQVFE